MGGNNTVAMQGKEGLLLIKRDGVQTLAASLVCVLMGLVAGYVVLLAINPSESARAMGAILKNFMYLPSPKARMEYFGSTLTKNAPLLMCTLSVLFAYKVGLFNIGASGQYSVGAGLALFCALKLHAPWPVCLFAAMAGGAVMGTIAGALKAYLNVNEVIAGIMLNWMSLYLVNTMLSPFKSGGSTYTGALKTNSPGALLPGKLLQSLFGCRYITVAVPLSVIIAVVVMVVMDKTKLGYELRATGLNKNAAKYAGMKEKRNTILTMAISGLLAGTGAAFLFLSGIEQWSCAQTAVPAMGFNGIAAAFLGALNPIACIFSSFFIQHITSGGSYVNKMVYCAQISDLISSIIIYFCSFALFIKHCIRRAAS